MSITTLTAANINDHRDSLGYEIALSHLKKLTPEQNWTVDGAIDVLGDKVINGVASVIKARVVDGWLVADPIAAEQFVASYKSKDKLALRREILRDWFTAEGREYAAVVEAAYQRSVEIVEAARPAFVEVEPEPELVESPAPAPEQIVTLSIAPPVEKKQRAPRAKKEKPPVEKKPRGDKYTHMTVDELRAEVDRMFPGTKTNMSSEAHLRYRLRLGEKQLQEGKSPTFHTRTTVEPTVKLKLARAEECVRMLQIAEQLGHGVAGMIISEIEDQITKLKSAPAEEQRAAA